MTTELRSIGPLDPDNSSQLTERLGVHNRAHELLQRHARNYPVALVSALSTPLEPRATEFVRDRANAGLRDAIIEYARGLRGRQAFLREEDTVEDISVRAASLGNGLFADPTYFAITYRKPSGRSARAVVPYTEVPEFDEAFSAKLAAADGTAPAAADQELGGDPAELTAARKEAAELRQRLTALEEQAEASANPEPIPGYDETNANTLAKRIREEGAAEFGRTGLQRILDYEEARDNPRTSIVEAVKDAQAAVAEA